MASSSVFPFLNHGGGSSLATTTLNAKNIKVSGDTTRWLHHDSCTVGGGISVTGEMTVNSSPGDGSRPTFQTLAGPQMTRLAEMNTHTEANLREAVVYEGKYSEPGGLRQVIEDDPLPLQLCCLYEEPDFYGKTMCFLPGEYRGPNALDRYGMSDRAQSVRCAPGVKATLWAHHNYEGGSVSCPADGEVASMGKEHTSMKVELIDKRSADGGVFREPLVQYECPEGKTVGCNDSSGRGVDAKHDGQCKIGNYVYCY